MFYNFRNTFFEQVFFSNHQIEIIFPEFDKKNLTRWQQKGYVIKLRNGLYTFSEYANEPGINMFAANRIYQPSYISLHFALNFYGIIPEVVNRITSVSTLKTNQFKNLLGEFSFQSVQTDLFFGYDNKRTERWDVKMACPEKAIIDLFYLYPMYNTQKDIEYLRFDSVILKSAININKLDDFLIRINNKSLNYRIDLMKKVYEL